LDPTLQKSWIRPPLDICPDKSCPVRNFDERVGKESVDLVLGDGFACPRSFKLMWRESLCGRGGIQDLGEESAPGTSHLIFTVNFFFKFIFHGDFKDILQIKGGGVSLCAPSTHPKKI
jgi:hypothetical protein